MDFEMAKRNALFWANNGKFPFTDFEVKTTEQEFEESAGWITLYAYHVELDGWVLSVYAPHAIVLDFQLEVE
jgi:hypothetical protein